MMFNPLEPSELILAVARLLRQAAEPTVPDEYRRSQLLSASSLARHLAAEQAAAAGLLAWLREQLDEVLADPRPPVATARAAIAAATTDAEIGTALTTLLAALGDAAEDRALRGALHTVLAELVDREVAVLAGAQA